LYLNMIVKLKIKPLALRELEDRLLVKEEQFVQVLTKEDGGHNFIEYIMWKYQMEEIQKELQMGSIVLNYTSSNKH